MESYTAATSGANDERSTPGTTTTTATAGNTPVTYPPIIQPVGALEEGQYNDNDTSLLIFNAMAEINIYPIVIDRYKVIISSFGYSLTSSTISSTT